MGNLVLKKVLAALLCSAVVVLLAIFLLPLIALQLVDGSALTTENLFNVPALYTYAGVLFLTVFAVVLFTLFVTPARRRRSRPSGTVVENDTEDGRERGTVKWFNMKKGFGFITWERGNDREDVFVHFRSIRGQGYRTLAEGQRVKFTIISGDKGPQAEDVSAVK